MDDDRLLASIGPRLKGLRQRQERTLASLSTETGISVSTLSRLESGDRKATLELLLPLARAYDLTLDELVSEPTSEDPRVRGKAFTKHGMTWLPLSRRPGGQQAYQVLIPAARRRPDPQVHEGHDWLYVLRGRLRLVVGEHDLVLGPGEVAEFDTRVPHWFGAAEARSVELVTVFSHEGERSHVSVRRAPR
jgi:transcriptional regulator with XRE-family HTH domain